ncbi:MAG: UdgX family uracil-DNA binding protein [Pseudolabrys sp.]|nr:UdgX family uracil-DNA binding protein [Pseudolabrys sp.]
MYRIVVQNETSLAEFRQHVRALIGAHAAPDDVTWTLSNAVDLFGQPPAPPTGATKFTVPSAYLELAADVLCHRDPERFALLYRLLWRLLREDRHLLSIFSDPLVYKLRQMEKAVGRDLHKMTAFLRFRKVDDESGTRFVAWFEPQQLILERAAEFFAKRFANMRWSVLTPDGTMSWENGKVTFGPGVPKSAAPEADSLEEWWKDYYRSTFNPARANPKMMRAEMPVRYWNNLPEASLIPELLAKAETRARTMIAAPPTMPRKGGLIFQETEPLADARTIEGLRRQARKCERCPLYAHATQTVFGEGPSDAPVVFVGEQPGDQEDLAGKPFVGPAGQMFDRAMADAGLDRSRVYVTNAVKHFKFEPRGKRRLHKKPNAYEIDKCRWWIDRELALIQPKLIVAMGATAARSLTGKDVKITELRGELITQRGGAPILITVHPSFLLRLPDEAAKRREYARFVKDLKEVAHQVAAVRKAA